MYCPKCQSKNLRCYNTQVYADSGWNVKGRWRICGNCQFRFTTVEMLGKVRIKDEKPYKIDLDAEYELAGSGQEAEGMGQICPAPDLRAP